jgi:hypothetical protein
MATRFALVSIGFIFGAVLDAYSQQSTPLDTGDVGELRPADPAKFYKEPGYSPYAVSTTRIARISAISTCTPAGRWMQG